MTKNLKETREFIGEFQKIFLEHSYGNHVFSQLAMHLILGRCTWAVRIPKGRLWLDGRISFWYLAPPSSGKSTPYDFIYKVLEGVGEHKIGVTAEMEKAGENLNQFIQDVDDTSDAVLIGYHDEEGKLTRGVLDRGGCVHWDEAAMLLGTSQYAEKTKGFLQKALNPIGSESNRCSRDFKSDSMSCTPTCSLYLTSYIPDGIVEKVLGTGLLQRVLCLPKDMKTEDRKRNAYTDINFLGTEPADKDLDIKYFSERFKKVMDKYNNPDVKFDWSKVKPTIKGQSDIILDLSRNSPKKIRGLLETFHPRYMDQMYIIAMHHCCLRDDSVITVDDIKYAAGIINACYRGLLGWLEDEPTMDTGKHQDSKFFSDIIKIFENMESKTLTSTQLVSACRKKWGVSEPTVQNRLKPLVQAAEQGSHGLKKVKKGRTIQYSIQR